MDSEEDDSSKRDELPSLLFVDDVNNFDVESVNNRELQRSEDEDCVFKSAINEMEFSPNTNVESLPTRDGVLEDENRVAEMEKKDVAEETKIGEEEEAHRNIVEDMADDSVKLEIETDVGEMGLLAQRVFDDVKADAGAVEVKVVTEFGDGAAEIQVGGVVLMANFPENTVGCAEKTGKTCLTDALAEERLAETSLFVQGVDVTDATNLVEKTEVEENADDPKDLKDLGVAKQENLSMEDRDFGVPAQLVENAELKANLVDGTNIADRTGDMLKMENVSSNADQVVLTNLAGEIDGAENMENLEDKTVKVDGMCVEEKTSDVAMVENLTDENPEIKEEGIADQGIEVLEDENVEDEGLGVDDESAEVEKTENMEDETVEAEGVQVTDYSTDDENAQVEEEIAMEEETEEADDRVYLVDEGIGSEDNDASMSYLVEETEAAEEAEEMDVTEEVDGSSKSSSGAKRKRGKNSKAPARAPSRKKVEEDVCFICFDGGDLVLCDRRGCPKAYHPSCINRDEAFFRAKGRWNCGWHLCTICEKTAQYMCYTCTFSLCKGCTKNAVILCVRGNKGLCETCMKFIMLIEKSEQADTEKGQIDFNKNNSWEFLFKEYWTDLKGSLSLTFDELANAKNPRKGSDTSISKPDSPDDLYDDNVDGGSDLDVSENEESGSSKKRKTKKKSKSPGKETSAPTIQTKPDSQGLSMDNNVEWASKELLEFVMHMKNGVGTALSQFDVQALLLEYIKKNKLRDPRRKSQIICDSRLESLFGKPRVGHFEMLKLLESHFLIRENAQINDLLGSAAETESSQLEADGQTDSSGKTRKDKKRKSRRKGDERGLQSNLDDYAAIDTHNINLIYLKRNLVEYLIEDEESFHDKAVGSFVRIRISGNAQKQDLYRLVQVVGTSKASEPYKVGKKMTYILLEILNLNKTEVVSIDIISNQEFTEEECKRLRQSMKCGILNRLTVGELQERAISLQDARVKDWMEIEIVRLSHLRDRASEKGRRKELRECVEKLQLLKTPEERQRRLEDIPEIHSDPKMDPNHESEDEDESDDKKQETYTLSRGSSFSRRTREAVSPGKVGSHLNDSRSGSRNFSNTNRDLSRTVSGKGFSSQGEDAIGSGEIINENSWSQGRDIKKPNKWNKQQVSPGSEINARNDISGAASELSTATHSVNPASSSSAGATENAAIVNESEKIWRYQDPSGKVQGPFSMVQLRKWSSTGYFPADLRVWRTSDKQEDSLLLTDVLLGKIPKDTPDNKNFQAHTHSSPFSGKPQGTTLQSGMDGQNTGTSSPHTNPTYGQSSGGRWKSQNEVSPTTRPASASSIKVSRYSGDKWSADHGNKNFTSLPSPTPSPVGTKQQPFQVAASFVSSGGIDRLHGSSVMQGTEKGIGSGPINALQNHHSQPVRPLPIIDNTSVNPAADIKSISANLHSLVQSINSRNAPIQTQKVESNLSSSMPPAQTLHSRWGEMSPVQNVAALNSAGTSTASYSTPVLASFPSSEPWRSTATIHKNPPHVQSSTLPNIPWGMGASEGQSNVLQPRSESQNQGRGPVQAGNTNMGWSASGPPNAAGMMWGSAVQSSAPVGMNPGWIAPGQGPPVGNNIQGWPAHNSLPPPMNATPGWVAPNVGPMPHMNVNPNWPARSANQDMWSNEHGKNGDRFSNQDGGSHSGDPGNGGKSWGRHSSYGGGGGSSRLPYNNNISNKGLLCKYHESGHCKKGGSCDYRH